MFAPALSFAGTEGGGVTREKFQRAFFDLLENEDLSGVSTRSGQAKLFSGVSTDQINILLAKIDRLSDVELIDITSDDEVSFLVRSQDRETEAMIYTSLKNLEKRHPKMLESLLEQL